MTLVDGTEQHWAYDSEYRLARFVDGECHQTRYGYGAFDLLETLIYPGGQSLSLGYDKLTRLTNGVGDGLPIGQQAGAIEEQANAQEAFAALPAVHWQHDRNGDLAQLLIGEHAPLHISRDALGREVLRNSAAGFNLQQQYNRIGLLTAQRAGEGATS